MRRRFSRIQSETVFIENWLRLVRHEVGDGDGNDLGRQVLVLDLPDWVNVVARTREGEFVLVRQHRFGTDAQSLEVPGGIIDPGEDPRVAGARELLEETGYRASSWRDAGWTYPNPAIQNNRIFTFVAEGCERVAEQSLDALEDCEVVLCSEAELRAKIARREISHALVLVALLEELLRPHP